MTEFQVHSAGLSGKRRKHRKPLAQLKHWVLQKVLNRLHQKKLKPHQHQRLHLQQRVLRYRMCHP